MAGRALLVSAAVAAAIFCGTLLSGNNPISRFRVANLSDVHTWLHSSNATLAARAAGLPRSLPAETVLAWVGWPSGVNFLDIRYHRMEQLLASPALQAGALLVVLPGRATPLR